MNKFKTVKCPKCHQIQVTSAKILKCKYCGKQTKILKKKGRDIVIYDERRTGTEASQFIQEFKREIINKKYE